MSRFTYQGLPARVIFGRGASNDLPAEVEHLGARAALVLCTPQQRGSAEEMARKLGMKAAGIFDQATMHVPIETAVRAREAAQLASADCCVAIGGGSTIGLAKAIALTSSLPIIAVPTTFAGSEMTPIFGLTEGGVKRTGRDARVLPRTVIYDPDLVCTMPPAAAVTSGMNAVAHAVEALYAQDANPIHSLMAEESIRSLAMALPRIVADPGNVMAWSDGLYGAWLAGACLGAVGMALHHKLCHTLGGTFNLPHAEMHTAVLPHSVAYNRTAAAEPLARVAAALGCADAASGLYELPRKLGAEMALARLGMPEDGLGTAADLALQNAYYNPRPLERGAILSLLGDAWAGRPPPG